MKYKILFGCIIILSFAVGLLCYAEFTGRKKTAYVTTLKVFEGFSLKEELENDYKKIQVIKQSYLDSIKLSIQTLSLKSKLELPDKEEKIELSKRAFLIKEKQFNEENEILYEQYKEQIWTQLNQFIEDFGKENGYDYLFGASGQGNIMYANDKEDVTKQIIEYVNNKYRGKKIK